MFFVRGLGVGTWRQRVVEGRIHHSGFIRPSFSPNRPFRASTETPRLSIVRRVISGRRADRHPLAKAHTVVTAHTNPPQCLSFGASRVCPIRVTTRARSAPVSAWPSPSRPAPRRRMCFSPPPDPRGSARAAAPRATARHARASRAPFPRVLDAARAPGRRAHVDSPDAPSIEPRLASDRRVVSPLPAGRSASGRENRSTEKPRAFETVSPVKPPSRSTAHRAFRFTKKIRTPDAAFTSPRATSRSSTRSFTTSRGPAAG